jgi:propionyl-CoA carboxylase alpha subunit
LSSQERPLALWSRLLIFLLIYNRDFHFLGDIPKAKEKSTQNNLVCPMFGLVMTILVKPGERVYRGQDLISIESMKMESFVASPKDGEVEAILVKTGQAVETGEVLLIFKKELKAKG